MNAIEKRFFDSYEHFIEELPSASVHSESWAMKIADYSVCEGSIFSERDNIGCNFNILFPTLNDEIKNNCIGVYLKSQDEVGSYLVDFTLLADGFWGTIVKLAIEIDGHDFHEKTKEQAARDKRRDREITMNDYYMLRFTGSEIYTNPVKCIKEIFDVLVSLIFERYTTYPDFYISESIEFDRVVGGNKND
jgi:very-short-patch-repair endonuclease